MICLLKRLNGKTKPPPSSSRIGGFDLDEQKLEDMASAIPLLEFELDSIRCLVSSSPRGF